MSVGLLNLGLTATVPWGAYLSVFLDAYTANMLFKCASDPPAMPDFSDFNPADLLGGILNPAFKPAQAKLQAAFENWFWYQFCFCSQGSLTTPAPLPAPPPLSLSLSGSSNATPCFAGGWSGKPPPVSDTNASFADMVDITTLTLPVGANQHTLSDTRGAYQIYQSVPGVANIRATGWTPFKNQGPGVNGSYAIYSAWDAAFTLVDDFPFFNQSPNAHQFDFTYPVRSTTAWYRMSSITPVSLFPVIPADPMQFQDQVYCGSSPSTLQSCCPPDPAISAGIQAILNSIANIQIGGGLPPGSYVDSTVHSGLRGLGTIPIAKNTLAVRAVIVQDNNQLPVGVGQPPYLFNRGFIVPEVSRGSVRGNVRLTYNPQLYVLPNFTEQIGYTLAPGLVVDMTELIAGP